MSDAIVRKDGNTLEVDAVTDMLPEVQTFVEEHLEALDCPMKTMMQIDVVVEEIFVNIAHYAYEQGIGKATVLVETCNDPISVKITFMDQGLPYNPLAREDPDVTLKAQDRSIGGLGIFMTKKLMDDVAYEYKDGQNILTLKKTIQ